MPIYRQSKYRYLTIGQAPTNPQTKFRYQMDNAIRKYQLNDPIIHHITNHPKSAPARWSVPMRPHMNPLGVNPENGYRISGMDKVFASSTYKRNIASKISELQRLVN